MFLKRVVVLALPPPPSSPTPPPPPSPPSPLPSICAGDSYKHILAYFYNFEKNENRADGRPGGGRAGVRFIQSVMFGFLRLGGPTTWSPTGEKHDIQSHMFRPSIADMQDKYCGDRCDIYRIQSRYMKVARPSAAPLFRGFLCWDCGYSKYWLVAGLRSTSELIFYPCTEALSAELIADSTKSGCRSLSLSLLQASWISLPVCSAVSTQAGVTRFKEYCVFISFLRFLGVDIHKTLYFH